ASAAVGGAAHPLDQAPLLHAGDRVGQARAGVDDLVGEVRHADRSPGRLRQAHQDLVLAQGQVDLRIGLERLAQAIGEPGGGVQVAAPRLLLEAGQPEVLRTGSGLRASLHDVDHVSWSIGADGACATTHYSLPFKHKLDERGRSDGSTMSASMESKESLPWHSSKVSPP